MTVVFRDAEQIVGEHVRTALATVDVYSKVPAARTPADTFVLIRRVGGVARNVVTDEATLAVEAWAPTKPEAHDLIQTVRALIHEMPTTGPTATPVYRVTEFAGPAYLPDPDSTHDRLTFTVSVALRGADSVTL